MPFNLKFYGIAKKGNAICLHPHLTTKNTVNIKHSKNILVFLAVKRRIPLHGYMRLGDYWARQQNAALCIVRLT